MPFTRISLLKGKPPLYLGARSDGLRQALVESFEVAPDDRFQVIDQREPGESILTGAISAGRDPTISSCSRSPPAGRAASKPRRLSTVASSRCWPNAPGPGRKT
jgi:hypothetical protein